MIWDMNRGSLISKPAFLTTVYTLLQPIVSLFTLASRKLREKLVIGLHFEVYIYIELWLECLCFSFDFIYLYFPVALIFENFYFFFLLSYCFNMCGSNKNVKYNATFIIHIFRWKASGNFIVRHFIRKRWSG